MPTCGHGNYIPENIFYRLAMKEKNETAEKFQALIVDETNTIIDGHNRYEICTKHNIPFNVVVRHFDSRDDIIVFICRNQIGRRNLSPDTLSYVIGLMYNLEKKRRGGERGNQHTKLANGKNCQLPRNTYTSEKIAKIAGVSEKSVRNAGQFASAVDTLSENEPSVKAAILSGKSGLTRKSVVEIAAMGEGLFMFCGADGTYPGQPETAPCYPDALANIA